MPSKTRSAKQCPVCRAPESEPIHSLSCGNLDHSTLYPTVRINHCLQCHHVFNELSPNELEGLNHYYSCEYAPANLQAPDLQADRPGSAGKLTAQRYSQLYGVISPFLHEHHEILDVGCALGGFLDYLCRQGYQRLAGVDMAAAYVEQARKKNRYPVQLGNAESLPCGDQTFDVIVMEQVLEHLVDPVRAFQEAKRVLKDGGLFCIGVPDAARYGDFYFFDFYWLLLREHIQHFDLDHLKLLAINNGFEMLASRQTTHAVTSGRMIMPNFYVVFRSTNSKDSKNKHNVDYHKLKQQMATYITQEKSRQLFKMHKIADLGKSCRPVYVWGIGREFLYLFESAGLKNCNLAGLIDGNKFKQESCSIKGMKIMDPGQALTQAAADAVLLITAVAHAEPIRLAAKTLGFQGEILEASLH